MSEQTQPKRKLIITIEFPPSNRGVITDEVELHGDETAEDLEGIAETVFFNTCNYGFEVV